MLELLEKNTSCTEHKSCMGFEPATFGSLNCTIKVTWEWSLCEEVNEMNVKLGVFSNDVITRVWDSCPDESQVSFISADSQAICRKPVKPSVDQHLHSDEVPSLPQAMCEGQTPPKEHGFTFASFMSPVSILGYINRFLRHEGSWPQDSDFNLIAVVLTVFIKHSRLGNYKLLLQSRLSFLLKTGKPSENKRHFC